MGADRAGRIHGWVWIGLIWAAVGIFDATQNVVVMRSEGMHHAWARLFLALLISWVPWAVATPFIVHLGDRFPPARLRPAFVWPVHLAACAVIGLIHSAWGASLTMLLNPYASPMRPGPFATVWLDKFYNGLLSFVVLYASILAVSFVLDSRERIARQQAETARLNEELYKAQLTALQRQIEPHFLFNTLNAIAGLVREKRNDAAVNMIVGLSDFLRSTVRKSDVHRVTLGEEMDYLQKYLEIQKARFAERLQLSLNVPEELLPARVPSLLLQPIVENAIKHGIAKRAQGGKVAIAVRRMNGTLKLVVYNDGPGLARDWKRTSGIGLSNMRTRLQGLYGGNFDLVIQDREPGGVEVAVSLPYDSIRQEE
jgi:two-component system LytT family sensor kinase